MKETLEQSLEGLKVAAQAAMEKMDELRVERQALLDACKAASHALKSYQYGNASPDLAKEMAEYCDAAIAVAEAS